MNLRNRIDRLSRTRDPVVVVIIGGFIAEGELPPPQRDDEDKAAYIARLTKEPGAIHTGSTVVVHIPHQPRAHALRTTL